MFLKKNFLLTALPQTHFNGLFCFMINMEDFSILSISLIWKQTFFKGSAFICPHYYIIWSFQPPLALHIFLSDILHLLHLLLKLIFSSFFLDWWLDNLWVRHSLCSETFDIRVQAQCEIQPVFQGVSEVSHHCCNFPVLESIWTHSTHHQQLCYFSQ